jgi:hypothetical protein
MIDDKIVFEHFARAFCNIGHVCKVVGTFAPQPFIDLIAAKGFVAVRGKKMAQLLF